MKKILLLITAFLIGQIFLPSFNNRIFAQQCLGNLGENIFIGGDFGSGAANVVPIDPLIAPGYIYTTNPPPNDGEYTITNSTALWPGNWPTWLNITDNSPDYNGYMLIVNAANDPGVFFEQQITDLCENTLYEFSVDIINLIVTPTANHVLPNISFFINNSLEFDTGDIPQDETWTKYGFTFETLPGQTSMSLSLRNNAPGGFGNDIAMDNISLRACGPELNVSVDPSDIVCQGTELITLSVDINIPPSDIYVQWQTTTDGGLSWSDISGAEMPSFELFNLTAATYLYRYIYGNSPSNLLNEKCQIISDAIEINVVPDEFSIAETICDGTSYSIGNSIYTVSGIYADTLTRLNGCDSIVLLDLTVINNDLDFVFDFSDPICIGDDNGLINITEIINGRDPIDIAINNENYLISDFPINVPIGVYNINIQDKIGCSASQFIELNTPQEFIVSGLTDLVISLGESIVLNPVSSMTIDSISWTPSAEFTCDNCLQPKLIPLNSGTYLGTFWNMDGCIYQAEFDIRVRKIRPIFIPDAFTPNGDGTNDFFTLLGNTALVANVLKLQVFNRWGDMIYNDQNLILGEVNTGWDGLFNDSEAPTGVYIYNAEILFIDGMVIEYKGTVSLLR